MWQNGHICAEMDDMWQFNSHERQICVQKAMNIYVVSSGQSCDSDDNMFSYLSHRRIVEQDFFYYGAKIEEETHHLKIVNL